jgi:galactokinase/mevalonate kinase-like predicted kinase
MELSIPARVNLLGNPSDGNEGDFATISAAVEIRAYANVEAAGNFVLAQTDAGAAPPEAYPLTAIPLPFIGAHDLLKGAVNGLYAYSPEFREKVKEHGMAIGVRSDVPKQSGLAGSTLLIALTMAGLRELYALDRRVHNDYILAELIQRVEVRDLGITGGFSDRYITLFGGLAYLDYRGKLYHREIGEEPLATYERLEVDDLPLAAVMTGVRHESGDVHGRMRPRYIAEYDRWKQEGGETPPMVRFMSGAYETAWRGKIALLAGDLRAFGSLMNENHRLVDEMMRYCGFADGAGWANNLFIQAAREHGALGAKLTGAGSGGSVFALTEPGGEESLMRTWRALAAERGLKDAVIYRLRIARQGLVVETSGG